MGIKLLMLHLGSDNGVSNVLLWL